MKDETKLEVKLTEDTTQEDEETKKKLSRRMQGLMELQYGKDLSDGELRASARLLHRKKTMMMCFKFLLKNGTSTVAEIRKGIEAEAQNILSQTHTDVEQFSEQDVSQGSQGKAVKVMVKVPTDLGKSGHLYKLGEKLPSGERKSQITQQTTSKLCEKMAHGGVLNAYITDLHKGFTLYEISDRFQKHVDEILREYRLMFSMCAYKMVSYQGVLESDLKKSPEFLKLCAEFLLTLDEGINALKENKWKVSVATLEGQAVLSRKEQ